MLWHRAFDLRQLRGRKVRVVADSHKPPAQLSGQRSDAQNASRLLALRDEDELTELGAVFDQFMRAAGFRKRQRAIHDGANLAARDELHRV